MNKHFRDAWYYLRRAGTHVGLGVREEFTPMERRLREMTGRERDPKPSQREKMRQSVRDTERTARHRARDAMHDARTRLRNRTSR